MRLSKHHGLGNDFLVLVEDEPRPDADVARAVCDRHRGVGADGLLHLWATDDGVGMILLNADGGRAEMSGNGIACLAQAAVLAGMVDGPAVAVRTDAGPRIVALEPAAAPRTHLATVGMGPTAIGQDEPAWAVEGVSRAVPVDVGNPHLVLLLADPARLSDRSWLVEVGEKANASTPGGVNVEAIAPGVGGEVRMDVYERGVGLTDACGTGAVASAAAARRWGLAGDDVTVRMVGGPVRVRLDGEESTLTTSVTHVADVEFPWP
jgi:diaminopimelate epimerase